MSDLTPPSASTCATIHLGASSISLLISSHAEGRCIEQIDFLEQSAPIAHDVFSRGKLTRSTIERCVNILLGYQASLKELGLLTTKTRIRVVATNILSEAANVEIFINRIHISSGLNVDILDDGEMTRLIYLKTRRRLNDTPSMKTRNTLVLHVGPGNTRAILLKKGRIVSYSSYRLGVHRTAEDIANSAERESNLRQLIRSQIQGPLDSLLEEYSEEELQDIVLIGYEIQTLHPHIKHNKNKSCSIHALKKLCDATSGLSDDQIVQAFQVDYQTAEAIKPALEINLALIEALTPQCIHIPQSDYEQGLLHDLNVAPSISEGFTKEVIRSAEKIAKKFKVDLSHARQVSHISLQLFEQLQELHKLSPHDALLLHIAAILHESGGFISNKAHHKHSQYIILNSEIFGLTRTDIELIALIARYHRNSLPKPNHNLYKDLTMRDRMRISKLSSLLRIADALDRPHKSRVNDVQVRVSRRRLHIHLPQITDAHTERNAMRKKGDLFENVFGLEINIVEDKIL